MGEEFCGSVKVFGFRMFGRFMGRFVRFVLNLIQFMFILLGVERVSGFSWIVAITGRWSDFRF